MTGISLWAKNGGLGSLTYDDAMPKTGHTAGTSQSLWQGSRKFIANIKLLNLTCDAKHVATDSSEMTFRIRILIFPLHDFLTGSTTSLLSLKCQINLNCVYCTPGVIDLLILVNKCFPIWCGVAESVVSIPNFEHPIRRSRGYWTGIIRQAGV